MQKRVLIVTELFEPMNAVGAVRPSKLAKYLTKNGCDVTVFTSSKTKTDPAYEPKGFHIVYDGGPVAKQAGHAVQQPGKAPGKRKNTIAAFVRGELSRVRRQNLAMRAGTAFRSRFFAAVDSGLLDLNGFDCVFTTFGPIGPVLTGLRIKKRCPGIRWINDFRDPMVSRLMPAVSKPLYGAIQRESVRRCDWVTTVSEGYRSRIQTRGSEEKFRVIPNGFDADDRPETRPAANALRTLELTYAGALYEGRRDLSPVFQALRRIVDEGVLPAEQIVFHYAGKDLPYLTGQAGQYGMEDIIKDHGLLPRAACLRLQAASGILVLSTWNDRGEEGVFPGKLIEYMLMERPILSVVDGTLPGAEVTDVIRRLRLGAAYERADRSTEQELYTWLKTQALRARSGEPLLFDPDREAISNTYDWKQITERFCELIDG